jgi:biotin carboxylase
LNETVVVLGGSWQQLELVKAARRRGFRALVLDQDAQALARDAADEFVQVDISDVASCVAIASQSDLAAVLSSGTDWAVASLAAIAETAGLPGPSRTVASTLRDKEQIHKLASRMDVPMPEFGCASDHVEAAEVIRRLGLPVVVKPVDGAGSRGVSLVTQSDCLSGALDEAFRWSRRGRLCIERYVSGVEFGCQAIVWPAGQISALWAHNDELLPMPLLGPVGHSMPLSARIAEHVVRSAVIQLVSGLPPFTGALNFDFIWTPAQLVFLEVGCRFGGGCLSRLISLYDGTAVPDLLLQISLGCTPSIAPSAHRPVAARHIGSAVDGVLAGVEVPARPEDTEELLSVEYHKHIGEPVSAMINASSSIITVYATGMNVDEAQKNVDDIAQKIEIEVSKEGG